MKTKILQFIIKQDTQNMLNTKNYIFNMFIKQLIEIFF